MATGGTVAEERFSSPGVRRVLLTILTLVGLFTAYGVYHVLVTPFITAGRINLPEYALLVPSLTSPRENALQAEEHLAIVPWAAKAKYQLRTADSFIYFDSWDRVEGDKGVRFRPFAMILVRMDEDEKADNSDPREKDEPPVTVVSDSALLRFESKFEMTNSNPGRIVGGSLEGNVRIRGPNALDLIGRNFVYSESARRIWSDDKVQFAYATHRGRGLGLQLELHIDENPPKKESIAITGIKNVKLRRNVEMTLVSERRSSVLPGQKKSEPDEDKKPRAPVQIHVTCDGSFEFEMQDSIARFEDNVRVRSPSQKQRESHPQRLNEVFNHQDRAMAAAERESNLVFDTLNCDLLHLLFEPKMEEDLIEEPQPAPALEGADSEELVRRDLSSLKGMTLRAIRAESRELANGKTRNVVVQSEANELTAEMRWLEHDAKHGTTQMRGTPVVKVVRQGSTLTAPYIVLSHTDGGKIAASDCRGPGRLLFRDPQSGQTQMKARWGQQLKRTQDPKTGHDLIELHQHAVVSQPEEQFGLAGEYIFIRLKGDGNDLDKNRNDGKSGAGRLEYVLAIKDVGMISPDMQAEANRLEVRFKDGKLPPKEKKSETRVATKDENPFTTLEQKKNATKPAKQETSPFEEPILRQENKTAEKEPSGRPPVLCIADRIQVAAIHDPEMKRTDFSDVWTFGNVHIEQQREPGEPPFEVDADRAHLVNSGQGREVIHIFGSVPAVAKSQPQPAHIREGVIHIQGNEIHFDRGTNRAWVNGPGLLELPVKESLDGQKLEQPEVLGVTWHKKMDFNGRLATFTGKVESKLNDHWLNCHEMAVQLTNRIDFAEAKDQRKSEQAVEVDKVTCRGVVRLNSNEYEDSVLVNIRRAEMHWLQINQTSGETLAQGPGWITNWSRGGGRRAGLGQSVVARPNAPAQKKSNDWEYTRIDFAGKMEGNMKDRNSTFRDRVRIVYGPVKRPRDVINTDSLPKDGGLMECDELRVVQIEKTATTPAFLQVFGQGNAKLEGNSFHARADTISYDESKELYVLRSLGNPKATIWRRKSIGGEYSRADAQRMEFIPSRNVLKLDRATGLDGSQ